MKFFCDDQRSKVRAKIACGMLAGMIAGVFGGFFLAETQPKEPGSALCGLTQIELLDMIAEERELAARLRRDVENLKQQVNLLMKISENKR